MFTADESLNTPFMKDEIVRYQRAVDLLQVDRPMVIVSPTFMSTKNATNLLSNILPITSFDQADRQRCTRYQAYIHTVWVDAPSCGRGSLHNLLDRENGNAWGGSREHQR